MHNAPGAHKQYALGAVYFQNMLLEHIGLKGITPDYSCSIIHCSFEPKSCRSSQFVLISYFGVCGNGCGGSLVH